MNRFDGYEPENLKNIISYLDNFGYYSMLVVYHSRINDNWIKAARVVSKNQKIKFMIAMRTYAISPEYFSMMYNAFEEIVPNKLIFNIVSGDLHADENSINDVLLINDEINTVEKRVAYTKKWMEKLKNINLIENMPEFIMAGASDETLKNASEIADCCLIMYNTFIDNPERLKNNKNIMLSMAMVIRDSKEEADIFFQTLKENEKTWTLCGTETDILEKIKYLKENGITDILITRHKEDQMPEKIHNFILKINEGNN